MSRGRRRDNSQVDSEYEADLAYERRRGCSPSPSPDAQARIAKKPRAARSSPDGTSEEEERRRRRLLANRRSAQRSRVKRLEEVGVLENLVDDLTKEVDELKVEIGCWTNRHKELLSEHEKLSDLVKASGELEGGASLCDQSLDPDWRQPSMPPKSYPYLHQHQHQHQRQHQHQHQHQHQYQHQHHQELLTQSPPQPQQPSAQAQQLQPLAHMQQHPQQQNPNESDRNSPSQQLLLRHPTSQQQPAWGHLQLVRDTSFDGHPMPHVAQELQTRPSQGHSPDQGQPPFRPTGPTPPQLGGPAQGKEYLCADISYPSQPGPGGGGGAVADAGAQPPHDLSYSPHGPHSGDGTGAKSKHLGIFLRLKRESTAGNMASGGDSGDGGGAGGTVDTLAAAFMMQAEAEIEGGSGTSSPHVGRPVASDPPYTPGVTHAYGDAASASASAGQASYRPGLQCGSLHLLQHGGPYPAHGPPFSGGMSELGGSGDGAAASTGAVAAAVAGPPPPMAPSKPEMQLLPHQQEHQHRHCQTPNLHRTQHYHHHQPHPQGPDGPHLELPSVMSAPHPMEPYDRVFHDRHSEAGRRSASDDCLGFGAVSLQLGRRTDLRDAQLSHAGMQPCGGFSCASPSPGFDLRPDPGHAVHHTASPGDSSAAGRGIRGWGATLSSTSPSFESKGPLIRPETPTASKPATLSGPATHRTSGGGAAAAALVHHAPPGAGVGVSLDSHFHPHLRHPMPGSHPGGPMPRQRSGVALPYHAVVGTAATATAGPHAITASAPVGSAAPVSPHLAQAAAAAAGAASSAAPAPTPAASMTPAVSPCDVSGSSTPPYCQPYNQMGYTLYAGGCTTAGSLGHAIAGGGGGGPAHDAAPPIAECPLAAAAQSTGGRECDMEPSQRAQHKPQEGPAAAMIAAITASADSTCSNNSNRQRSESSDSDRSLTCTQETVALRPIKSEPPSPMQEVQLQLPSQQQLQQQQQQQQQEALGLGMGLHQEIAEYAEHAPMADYTEATGSMLLDSWDLL